MVSVSIVFINRPDGYRRKRKEMHIRRREWLPTMFMPFYAEGDYVWFGGIEGEFTRYDIRTDTYTYYPIDCIGDIKPGKGAHY